MADFDITSDLTDGTFDGGTTYTPSGSVPSNGTDSIPAGSEPKAPVAETPAAPAAEEPAAPSLRETLSNAFKQTEPTTGPARNPDGTFAPKIDAVPEGVQPVADPNAPQTPAWLTPELAPQYSSLPAELQQFVASTMEDAHGLRTRYSEYDQIENSLIAPRREAWQAQGVTPAAALQYLFNLSDFASTEPGKFALWFADKEKLDLDALLDERDAELADPVKALERKFEDRFRQLVPGNSPVPEQSVQPEHVDAVRTFYEEKDGAGKPLRPYLPEVGSELMAFIPQIRAANPSFTPQQVLEQAYQKAIWANDGVREKLRKTEENDRLLKDRERAQKAKVAGSSVNGAPTANASNTPNNANRSLREEIKYQFDQQSLN